MNHFGRSASARLRAAQNPNNRKKIAETAMTVIISCETNSVAIISSMKALHTQSAATMQTVRQFSHGRGALETLAVVVPTALSTLKFSVIGTSSSTYRD
jgi:hypothetical protein